MTVTHILRLAVAAAGLFLVTDAIAAGQVTFDLKFSGHTDCFSPEQIEDVPISVKGTAVLKEDGSATMDLKLTAYYVLGWKYHLQGKLGDPPQEIGMGVTGKVRVLSESALSLDIDFPETVYTTNVATIGKKCGAELVATPKNGKGIYNLPAGDTMYQCNRFVVEKSFCRVK